MSHIHHLRKMARSSATHSDIPRSWLSRSHVPFFKRHPDTYTIAALQNSSIASAEKSRAKYSLGDQVKCYDNPASLANDPDVDIVVVSVKVPMHYSLIKPALEAKKDVFVEWPLAKTLAEAEELTQLAKEAGVRTFVGLQARQSPAIVKAKEMIESGELGEILGSKMFAHGMVLGPQATESYEYISDVNNGANLVTIPAGHAVDALCFVLGEFKSLSATLDVRQPKQDIVDGEGKVLRTIDKSSHDFLSLTGILQKSRGLVTVVYQGGTSDTGKDFYWEINGSLGTLVLEGPSGHIQMSQPSVKFVKAGAGVNELKEIQVERGADPSHNVGVGWNAFIGKEQERLVSFEEATRRHRMIEAIYRSNETGRRETYL
jgi:predicted dehydrogenase